VRNVARQLVTSQKLVDSTRAARDLAVQRLDAEQKKLAAGTSTNFLVFQAQRDLAQARNDELNSILAYTRAQIDFETVQVAPVAGASTATAATVTSVNFGSGAGTNVTATSTTATTGAGAATRTGGGGGQ
jgi:hypothetical protein